MPTSDPTFQHSDEDWTQITQPRLRKRVQNRVSQRKHRDKVRKQRANSIDAEQALSNPTNSTRRLSSHASLCSDGSSQSCAGEYHLPDYVPPQQPLDLTLSPSHDGFEPYDYDCFGVPVLGGTGTPWVGNVASMYEQPSHYPLTSSSNIPSSYSHDPTYYGSSTAPYSKKPSLPTSMTSSTYNVGTSGVDSQWYHMPSTSASPSSYGLGGTSAMSYPHHTSYSPLQFEPTRGCSPSYTAAVPQYSTTKSSPPTRSTRTPASYLERTLLHNSLEPQGSGINPSYAKHSKHHQGLSISHSSKASRR